MTTGTAVCSLAASTSPKGQGWAGGTFCVVLPDERLDARQDVVGFVRRARRHRLSCRRVAAPRPLCNRAKARSLQTSSFAKHYRGCASALFAVIPVSEGAGWAP